MWQHRSLIVGVISELNSVILTHVNVSFVTTVPNKDIGDMLDVSAPCPVDTVIYFHAMKN